MSTKSQKTQAMIAIDRVISAYMIEIVDEVGSQSAFQRKTGISQAQVSRWKTGDRPVTWLQLLRTAEANLIIGDRPLTIDRLLSEIAERIWRATRPGALREPMLEREVLSGRRRSAPEKGEHASARHLRRARTTPEDPPATHGGKG